MANGGNLIILKGRRRCSDRAYQKLLAMFKSEFVGSFRIRSTAEVLVSDLYGGACALWVTYQSDFVVAAECFGPQHWATLTD